MLFFFHLLEMIFLCQLTFIFRRGVYVYHQPVMSYHFSKPWDHLHAAESQAELETFLASNGQRKPTAPRTTVAGTRHGSHRPISGPEKKNMEVSWNRSTPKSITLIGIAHDCPSIWGYPMYGNPHMMFTELNNERNRTARNDFSDLFACSMAGAFCCLFFSKC